MPKETPTLFTGEMVRAILDGRKAQTRRMIKSPSRKHDHFTLVDYGDGLWPYLSDDGESSITDDGNETAIECPYGKPGDRLWVRETWAIGVSTGNSWHSENGRIKSIAEPQRYARRYAADGTEGFYGKWRPSIFMPKWACRLWLELTDVRVERLQEVTEADAIAEGVKVCPNMNGREGTTGYVWPGSPYDLSGLCHSSAITAFSQGFESINGADSWAANPWVWVLTFRRVEP